MNKQGFDELKTTGKLPSPSGVALRIMELCRQDDVGLPELARVVQADPALTGRLVKFANSAMAGPRRPVVAIADAIRVLGMNTVRQLALGFSVLGQHRAGACRNFDYPGFWSRSLASAIGCNALCLRTRAAAADEAFTCGLLLRIGSLALASLYPEGYGDLLSQNSDTPDRLLEYERKQLSTDHLEITAALLEEWMLPRVFVNAVYHHEAPHEGQYPDGSRESILCNVMQLGAAIGNFCTASDVERQQMLPDMVFGAARVGIDAEALAMLMDQVVIEWQEWGKILEVRTNEVAPFHSIADAAREVGPADRSTPTLTLVPGAGERPPAAAASGSDASEPVAPQPLSPDSLRVLLVDDDATILLVVTKILQEQGHQVSVARDGQEALRTAMREHPQLIVSDWMMPEMDGVSFCRALRETQEGRHIYFLLLTGLEKEEHLVEAFHAGVDDFVSKPVSAKVLLARLRAGQRVIRLQQEAARDSQSLRRFATELAVANRRLRQAALTDPLTGLPNRRYAMERLEQEWSAATRNQRTFSVMMVDIDRFRAVNDSFGHDAGDQVLRQVAMALRKAARSEDVICRLGGEEFLVVSPDTPLPAAIRLAERLRQAVCSAPAHAGAAGTPLSVSIGVAERGPNMLKPDELLKAADEVLFHAQRLGGNRIQAAGQGVARAASITGGGGSITSRN
jgi:two-component system cell cycle response regulator